MTSRAAYRFASAGLLAVALTAALTATSALAAPKSLGVFSAWSAFSTGTGDAKTCYVLAQPKTSEPKGAKRDPAYFLISDWPVRKAKGEAEVVPGYAYKAGEKVTVEIGADKFSFFTKNDDGHGAAWVESKADDQKLLDAMKRGSNAIVTGISERGTTTRDTYALAGLSAALEKAHAACGM